MSTGEAGREPRPRIQASDIVEPGRRHRTPAIGGAVQLVVMEDNGHAIGGQLDVELDPADAALRRLAETLERFSGA